MHYYLGLVLHLRDRTLRWLGFPHSDAAIPLPQEVSDSQTTFLGTVAAPAGTLWSIWLEDVHRLAPHLSSNQVWTNSFCFSPQFQVTYEVLPQGLVFSSDCVPSKEVNIDGGGIRLQGNRLKSCLGRVRDDGAA